MPKKLRHLFWLKGQNDKAKVFVFAPSRPSRHQEVLASFNFINFIYKKNLQVHPPRGQGQEVRAQDKGELHHRHEGGVQRRLHGELRGAGQEGNIFFEKKLHFLVGNCMFWSIFRCA